MSAKLSYKLVDAIDRARFLDAGVGLHDLLGEVDGSPFTPSLGVRT